MTADWSNAEHLNGPGFTAWCEAEGIVEFGALDRQLGSSLTRRYFAWRHGAKASVWLADELLIRRGRFLWEIPADLWLFESVVAVTEGLASAMPIKAIARAGGCSPDSVRYWRKRLEAAGLDFEGAAA